MDDFDLSAQLRWPHIIGISLRSSAVELLPMAGIFQALEISGIIIFNRTLVPSFEYRQNGSKPIDANMTNIVHTPPSI